MNLTPLFSDRSYSRLFSCSVAFGTEGDSTEVLSPRLDTPIDWVASSIVLWSVEIPCNSSSEVSA